MKTSIPGIYCLVFPSGHFYYGQSQNIGRRYGDHCSMLKKGTHKNAYIKSVFAKYRETPKLMIVCVCDVDSLNAAEQEFLDLAVGIPGCLNLARYADSPSRGRKLSDEERKKRSEARKGIKFSPERCANISAAKKGKPLSPARLAAMEALKGRKLSDEQKAKMSAARKGVPMPSSRRPMSDETKAKISAAKMGREPHNKGKKASAETRAKISAVQKGRVAHNKGKKASDETRAKLVAAHVGRVYPKWTEEQKARFAENRKEYYRRKKFEKQMGGDQ